MAVRTLLVVALAGCGVDGPSDVQAPPSGAFQAAAADADAVAITAKTGESFSIDLGDCEHRTYSRALPQGSMWILVHPIDGDCELWLGGETEDPSYNGSPSQYCRFYQQGSVDVNVPSAGGPARIDLSFCIDLP